MNVTPEIRQAIERSGGEPLRLEHSLTCETYVALASPSKCPEESGVETF
jgi:hypothetical protein